MISGKTIVMIATVPWSSAWQRQQELARQFAAHNQVLYVEPMGMRNHGPIALMTKLLKIQKRGRNPSYRHKIGADRSVNIRHIKLAFIPWHGVGWINRFNGRWLSRQLRRQLPGEQCQMLFWVCNPSDTVLALCQEFPRVVLVYDIAMRFAKRADAPAYLTSSQTGIAHRANAIFYDNAASLEDLPNAIREKAHFVPQGLHDCFYELIENKASVRTYSALSSIPHPRIGFVGAGHDAFDIDLVRSIVKELPDAQVVLAGIFDEASRLEHPRVHYVGAVPLHLVPTLLVGLDVGIIPYLINEYTAGVFPTKFFEYLAAGLPIVSTPLPELNRYKDYLTIALPEQFTEALAKALQRGPLSPDRKFLNEQSWSVRFAKIEAILRPILMNQT